MGEELISRHPLRSHGAGRAVLPILAITLSGLLIGAGPSHAAAPPPLPTTRTNASTRPSIPTPPVRTNLSNARPARAATTNAPALARPATGGTNAAVKEPAGTAGKTDYSKWLNKLTSYPVIAGGIAVFLVVLLLVRMRSGAKGAGSGAAVRQVKATRRKVAACNVLQPAAEARTLWQFDARGSRMPAGRQHAIRPGEPLPRSVVEKSWGSLFQRKLNIAWLPAEHVFLRAIQLPESDFAETLSMVELQLEKLSPMPVTQVVWTLQVLPGARDGMQTAIVMIAARGMVEEFLGKLEGQGYLADRLDLPLLDQLLATAVTEDGAWIYPDPNPDGGTALVAWWYGGSLRNLDLVSLSAENRAQSVKEQLLQMTWAGEMEGWMTALPVWHLVAEPDVAAGWEPTLREALEQPVQVFAPVPAAQLAGLTAKRASQAQEQGSLMPPEFAIRYQQQFVDRLWMRALLALGAIYGLGVLVYFVALGVASYRTSTIESEVAGLGGAYTNSIQLKARFEVLKDRQELKFAALDVWNVTARLMPEALSLDSMNFADGKRVTFTGSAPASEVSKLLDFEAAIRKASVDGQPLFGNKGDNLSYHANPAAGTVSWNFSLELNRVEVQ